MFNREREIIKASIVGIFGNMTLVVFKLIVGFAANSIAIILDAVNNATDALSSIVTIIGTKVAGKRADKRHPFGYGRIEYLTSVIIAAIILAAGLVSLRESVLKIMHPEHTEYTIITITVIVVAIIAKIFIGLYFRHAGKKTSSEALIASGIDSDYDAVLSAGTLVVAFAQIIWNVNIDGIVGVIISLVVCKAGIDVLRDAVSPLLGTPEDKELVDNIESTIKSYPNVHGVHDMFLDNFGPNEIIGSVRIEVDEDMTARQIHELTRRITEELFQKHHVLMTIGIYAVNEKTSGEYAKVRAYLDDVVKDDPKILGFHGLYIDDSSHTIYFDIVLDFKCDADKLTDEVANKMKKRFPRYDFNIVNDSDYEG